MEVVREILGTCSSRDLSLLELSSNDVDSIFATLEEAMELEEIECRIVVSCMVREAITRGVIRALEDESAEQLASKDLELCKMRNFLKSNEAKVSSLKGDILFKEQEFDMNVEDDVAQRCRHKVDSLHEREQIQEKWQESESLVAQKEKELSEMSTILAAESKRAQVLEKQLKLLQLKDSLRLKEMAGLHEEIERMEGDHDYLYERLECLSPPKELKLDDIYGPDAGEVSATYINQLKVLILEKTNQVTNLEMILGEKDEMINNLEMQLRGENLEANVKRAVSDAGNLYQVEHGDYALTEQLEEQKLLSATGQELLIILFEAKVHEMARELEQANQSLEDCKMECKKLEELSILQDFKSSLKGILDGMEKTLSSQKELADKKRGMVFGKHELLGKVDAELSYLKGKITEMSSFSTWQKEQFFHMQEEMNEERWMFEAENHFLCTYWQSLVDTMHDENASLCSVLYETRQKLNEFQMKASEMTCLLKGVAQVAGLETCLEDLAIELEGRLEIKEAEILCLMESLEECRWRSDAEAMLILSIMECLSREIATELDFCRQEMGLKDEEIFCLALEADHLKHVLVGLENDFTALKSLYTASVTDNSFCNDVHMDPFLQAMSDIINHSCGEAGGESVTFLEDSEPSKSRKMISEEVEANVFLLLQMMENLAEKKIQHETEMDIISEILEQKYQEAAERMLAPMLTLNETNLQVAKQKCAYLKNIKALDLPNELEILKRYLVELKVQLESFLYTTFLKSDKLESRFSSVLVKCEKLEITIKMLCEQAKEIKKRISMLQEEADQQEWRHESESELLVLVIAESLGEISKSFKVADIHRQDIDLGRRIIEEIESVQALKIAEDNRKANKEQSHGVLLKNVQSAMGNTYMDELISHLKREVEELRREKEYMLELKTEEIYKLKREFWKATEKGKQDYPPRNKEVEGLSKWFSEGSAWLQHMYKEAGLIDGDAVTSKSREDWHNEKVSLMETISLKERDLKEVIEKVSQLTAVEKNQHATISKLSAHVAELEAEKKQLVIQWRNKQSSISKMRKDWEIEKEELLETVLRSDRTIRNLNEKLTMMIEKQKNHDVIESQLQGCIDELEAEKLHSISESRRISLSELLLKEELKAEKAIVHNLISEKERNMEKLYVNFFELAGRESELADYIEELEIEKEELLETVLRGDRTIRHLNENLTMVVEKQKKIDVIESQLQGCIHELEAEKLHSVSEFRRISLSESQLKEELKAEKAIVHNLISGKERDMEKLYANFFELAERESVLADYIKELEIEKEELLETVLRGDRTIKHLNEKLTMVIEKQKNHDVIESQLQGCIDELEAEKLHSVSEFRRICLSESQLKEELKAEKAIVHNLISEKERDMEKLYANFFELAERESELADYIKELEKEKEELLETVLISDRTIRHLNEKLTMVIEKQKNHDVIESQLQGCIDELEAEKLHSVSEFRRISMSESQLKEELKTEKAIVHNLISGKERDMEKLYANFFELAERESELGDYIKELEIEKSQLLCKDSELRKKVFKLSSTTEKSESEKQLLDSGLESEQFTMQKLNEEWQIEKAALLEAVSQKERHLKEMSGKLGELLQKEESHSIIEAKLLAHVKDLGIEKEQLIMGQREKESLAMLSLRKGEEALALAIREKKEEENRCKILEMEVQDLLNKVKKFNRVIEASTRQDVVVQGHIQPYFAEQLDQFLEASQRLECEISQKIQENLVRLDETTEKFLKLNRHLKHSAVRESRLKEKLHREINNLRKAEAEVDLLGDEVDVLVDILEKAYTVLDLYGPVLRHYPEITDIARVINQELQLWIDPI